MKNKGFTLIELLGVIIILAILVVLVMPKIINSLKSSNDKVDDVTLKMIYTAAELYVSEYDNNFQTTNGNQYCISLKNLTKEGYLKSPINVNDTDITNLKTVQVTYNDGFEYELKNNKECEAILKTICIAVNSSKAGSTEIGTEYTCQVSSVESHNFYVLSTNTDGSVNLLMSENLVDNVAFIDKSNITTVESYEDDYYYEYAGTPYAASQTTILTSSWENLSQSARLPEFDELANEEVCSVEVPKDYGEIYMYSDDYYYEGCLEWSKGNYWTSTTHYYSGAWAMNTEFNTLDSFETFDWRNGELINKTFGIRPVITVPSSKLG
ncbi:MAG: prepilin-type N-terminal cleavage/methylation domain-containing protein [Bacilli bacterium]|nr:prepilin-type N-terminal cleavage/methylation domain-containing protein [Bacilli bacterium]